MRRILFGVLLVASLVAVAVMTVRVGRRLFSPAEPASALDYLPPGRCVFVAVRGAGDYLGWAGVVRGRPLPLVGRLNRLLYALEYAVDRRLTEEDLRELAGEDVLVRLWPRFLLVTRTKRSYNVFFRLRIREDTEARRGRLVYRTKVLPPDGRPLHYVFDRDWLVVADDPRELVRALRRVGRRRFPAGESVLRNSRFVLGWSGLPRRGGQEMEVLRETFGGRREGLVCGPSLGALRLYPKRQEEEVVSASPGWMFFRRRIAGRSVGVVGVSVFGSEGAVSAEAAYLVPTGLDAKDLRRLVEVLRDETGRPELHLAQEMLDGFHVVYDGGILPVPEREGVYFRLDGAALAREAVFDAEMAAFLRALGKVEVGR